MAKRHYSSSKESHGGSMDPKHYKHHKKGAEPKSMEGHKYDSISDGHYAGELARRTQEMQDAGMIDSDFNAIANMPQNVMMKPYPKPGPYLPEGLDDSIAGVDRQMDYDDEKRKESFYPKKV